MRLRAAHAAGRDSSDARGLPKIWGILFSIARKAAMRGRHATITPC
jgi:hypothetical protein